MPVDQQADQPIPMTVAVASQGGKQPVDFVLGQVLADPIGHVWSPSGGCDWSHLVLFTSLRRGDFIGVRPCSMELLVTI